MNIAIFILTAFILSTGDIQEDSVIYIPYGQGYVSIIDILEAFDCIEHVDADLVCSVTYEDNSTQYFYIFADVDYEGEYSIDTVKGSNMQVLNTWYYEDNEFYNVEY